MLNAPLARIFRRMVSRVSAPSVRSRRTVLEVTQGTLEPRLAPAALAAPTVDQTWLQYQAQRTPDPATELPAGPYVATGFQMDYINSQTAISPQNPLRQVVVAEAVRNYGAAPADVYSTIVAKSTTDGGVTWRDFINVSPIPPAPGAIGYDGLGFGGSTKTRTSLIRDPSKDPTTVPEEQLYYTNYEQPSATITRDGQVYIAFVARGYDSASGIVGIRRYNFNDSVALPTVVTINPSFAQDTKTAIAYRWFAGVNQAYYPSIANNPNVRNYTDPDTGTNLDDTAAGTFTDGTGQVYLTWGGNYAVTSGYTGPYNPNQINVVSAPNLPLTTVAATGMYFSGPVVAAGYDNDPNSPTFGTPLVGQNVTGGNRPQLAFTANNGVTGKTPTAAPGQLVMSYERLGSGSGVVVANTSGSLTVGGANGTKLAITDADPTPTGGTYNLARSTLFTVPVTVGPTTAGLALQNFSVSISIQHENLSNLELTLVAPGATFGVDANGTTIVTNAAKTYTLVRARDNLNATDSLTAEAAGFPGYGATGGLTGANLGYQFGAVAPTTFSDDATRRIDETGNAAPYIGTWRPDKAGTSDFRAYTTAQMMRTVFGALTLNAAANTVGSFYGNWTLLVNDGRDQVPPPAIVQFVHYVSIQGSYGAAGTGFNRTTFITAQQNVVTAQLPGTIPTPNGAATGVLPMPGSATAFGYGTTGILGGVTGGFGPNTSIAVDHSLGKVTGGAGGAARASIQGVTSGYLYIAQTAVVDMDGTGTISAGDDTDVFVSVYDTSRTNPNTGGPLFIRSFRLNDDTAADNFSTGTRFQYSPAVTVDSVTGTLVAAYRDARYDAANSRYATMLTTSNDGGATLSPAVAVNQVRQVTDVITGKVQTLEPLVSNPGANFPAAVFDVFGYSSIGVIASGGKIGVTFTGNPNGPGAYVYTAFARTAAGPQVVYADSGAIGDFTGTDAGGNATLVPTSVQLDNPIAPAAPRYYQYNVVRQGAGGTAGDISGTYLAAYPSTAAAPAAGTSLLDGIRVVFDRRVDPVSFSQSSDIRVFYTDPNTGVQTELRTLFPGLTYRIDNLSALTKGTLLNSSELGADGLGTGTLDAVQGNIIALRASDTDYVVRFISDGTASSGGVVIPAGQLVRVGLVGTYSYAVHPYVRDFYRNILDGQTQTQTMGLITNTAIPGYTAVSGRATAQVTPSTSKTVAGVAQPIDPLTVRTDTVAGNYTLYSRGYYDLVTSSGKGAFYSKAETAFNTLNGVAAGSTNLPGNVNDGTGITDIPITIPTVTGFDTASAADLISRAIVQVDMVHTRRSGGIITDQSGNQFLSGVIVQLVSPNNIVIPLSVYIPSGTQPLTVYTGGDGSDYDTFAYENTAYDQFAGQPFSAGLQRYQGLFRPYGDMSRLTGLQILPGSKWYLRVIDNFNSDDQFANPSGAYTNTNHLGYLRSWSLTVVPGSLAAATQASNDLRRGNYLDSDGDATAWEPIQDSFRAPTSTAPLQLTDGAYQKNAAGTLTGAGLFAQGPFSKTSLPLVIGGPRVIGASVRADDGSTATTGDGRTLNDQVYLNVPADKLYVRFDRAVNLASVQSAGVTVTTPDSTITLTGAQISLAAGRTDEVVLTFPTAFTRVGGYTVTVGNGVKSAAGDLVDVNQNAGVDRLFGGNSTSSTAVSTVTYAPDANLYPQFANGNLINPIPIKSAPIQGGFGGFTVTGETVAELPIPVADAFQIAQDLVRFPGSRVQLSLAIRDLNASAASSLFSTLVVDLVAPDGTRIRLLTGLGGSVTGPGTVTTNILFDDTATSPIGGGFNPNQTAPYSPQIPLSRLLGKWTAGTWKIVVTNGITNPVTGAIQATYRLFTDTNGNTYPVDVGQIVSAKLTLAGAVNFVAPNGPGVPAPVARLDTGLGEARADVTAVGFRVFNQIPTSVESSQVWQPIGQPTNNQANVGRVSAVTVDTADPTGNTVFAAGASGGVWKTTNFLTTDPDGPTWTPLTDFGVGTSINIASITVFNRPDASGRLDPSKTVVFALTGEGDSQTIPQGGVIPAGNTEWTSPGVGVLRSEDGGLTWQLLDSTTNVDASGNPLPVSSANRDRLFVGASGFKIVADPVAFQATDKYDATKIAVYMAVSGGRQASGFQNGAAGLWRSLDGGRNWVQLRAGSATDVALAPIPTGSDPNLQTLYAAFRNDPRFVLDAGVYFTSQATNTPAVVPGSGVNGSLVRLNGNNQNNRVVSIQGKTSTTVTVGAENGPFIDATRLTLAVPAVGNDPLANSLYRGWVYVTASFFGQNDGLYVSKDFGRNWTRVRLPEVVDIAGNVWGTNNEFAALVPDNQLVYNTESAYTANVGYQRPAGLYTDTPRQYIPRADGVFSKYATTPRSAGQGQAGTDPSNGLAALGTGNRALSLAVDPLNPAIVYLGGDRSIRVDISLLKDTQSYYYFDNTAFQGGTQLGTTGGVSLSAPPPLRGDLVAGGYEDPVAGGSPFGVIIPGYADPTVTINGGAAVYRDKYGLPAGYTNLSRDPGSPYSPSVIQTYNTANFTNNGENASVKPFDNILFGSYDVSSIVPFVDPQTGKTRLIYGTAQGIYTGVDDGRGNLTQSVGYDGVRGRYTLTDTQSSGVVSGPRNGNLQIAQVYAGAVQPTRLAADIAGALFYGVTQDNGYTVSRGDTLQTGNTAVATTDWPGTGLGVAVDQTGTGVAYQYRLASSTGTPVGNGTFGDTRDFVRVLLPGSDQSGSGKGATSNLLAATDNIARDIGQWRLNDTRYGTVVINPISATGLLVAASPVSAGGSGRLYRSTDGGVSWQSLITDTNPASSPTQGVYLRALAFGGVDPAQPSNRNNYILAGSDDGRVFFTTTGTAPLQAFTFTGADLGGRSVQRVIPNPRPGTNDFYILTDRGVFYGSRVSRTDPNVTLVDLTSNLYTITRTTESMILDGGKVQTTIALQDVTGAQLDLTALAVDWRYSRPVLYVGGQGGVFRTTTYASGAAGSSATWTLFPDNPAGGSYADGGYFPNARVTDLDLSLGAINPDTGLPNLTPNDGGLNNNVGGQNILLASTYGRGQYVIRIDPSDKSLPPFATGAFESGPRVTTIAFTEPDNTTRLNTTNGVTQKFDVIFDSPVDPLTILPKDITVRTPGGATLAVSAVTLNTDVQPGQPDPRNRYTVTLASPITLDAANSETFGLFFVRVGNDGTTVAGARQPLTISDLAGNRMNQNGNQINGEEFDSPNGDDTFTTFVYINGKTNSLLVTGLASKLSTQAPAAFTVTAIKFDGTTDKSFAGTVKLTSTDLNILLTDKSGTGVYPDQAQPISYTFTPDDNNAATTEDQGKHKFTATFRTGAKITNLDGTLVAPVGQLVGIGQTITVDLTNDPTGTYNKGQVGTSAFNARVELAPASLLAQVSTWDPQTVVANVVDYNGNRLPGFGGTITLSTNDTKALLPAPNSYAPGASNGTTTFTNVIYRQAGTGRTLRYDGTTVAGVTVDGLDPLEVKTQVLNAVLDVTGIAATVSTYDPQAVTVTVRSQVPSDKSKPLPFFNLDTGAEATVSVDVPNDPSDSITPPVILYPNGSNAVGATEVLFRTKGTGKQDVVFTAPLGVDPTTVTPNVVNAVFRVTDAATGSVYAPAQVTTWNPQAVRVSLTSPVTNKVLDRFTGDVFVTSSDAAAIAVTPDSDLANKQSPIGGGSKQRYTYTGGDQGKRQQTLLFRTGDTLSTGGKSQSFTFSGPVAGVDSLTLSTKVVNAVYTVTGLPDTAGGGTAVAGDSLLATVSIADPLNNNKVLTSFAEQTVTPGTDDAKATISPPFFKYTAVNAGTKGFVVTYRTAGLKTFNVPAVLGVDAFNTTVVVDADDAVRLTLGGFQTPVVAGTKSSFTVTAFDQFDNVAAGYRGLLNLSSSDQKAFNLPAIYTFAAGDNGSKTFANVELRTTGSQQITAAEPGGGGLSATQSNIVVTPDVASQFTLSGYPGVTIAGAKHALTLKASDRFGNTATTYTGKVDFSTNDPLVSAGNGLPTQYEFVAGDNGEHTFQNVELRTASVVTGTPDKTITATSANGALSSSVAVEVVAAPASTYSFTLTSPTTINSGDQVNFTLKALDRFGNQDKQYQGTVTFSSTDGRFSGAAPYKYQPGDGGQKTFTAFLVTAGQQTITASDAANGAVGTSPAITVNAGKAQSLSVAGFPATMTAGDTKGFTVTVFDQAVNIATGFAGKVTFTSSDPTAKFYLASAPTTPITSYTFSSADAGTQAFLTSLTAAGQRTVIVTPEASTGLNAGTVSTLVTAGAATKFRVSDFLSPVDAGTPRLARVTALDSFGNTADGYSGLVQLSSTDAKATLPPASKLTGGSAFFLVTLNTAGTQSITAADSVNAAVFGSQTNITVNGAVVIPTAKEPVISALPATTVVTGQTSTVKFTVTTFPLGTAADGLTYTATSSNGSLMPPSAVKFAGTGQDRTVSVTPVAGQTGSAVVTITVTDPATGLFASQDLSLTVNPVPPPPPPPPGTTTNYFAAGVSDGPINRMTVYNPDGSVLSQQQPIPPGFTDGIRTATVRRPDGSQLIAATAGPGLVTEVRLLDPVTGALVRTLAGFESSFTGGLFVAAGDVNGDGYEDIAISPDVGGGGRVLVYDGQAFTILADFFGIDDPSFRGGARVAFGDVNGDGSAELVVAAGFGGGPRVAVWDGTSIRAGRGQTRLFNDFFVFEQSLRNGVYVAAGDVNGDGKSELVFGGGPGGGPRVYALDGAGLLSGRTVAVADYFASDENNRDGVRVTVKSLDGDQYGDIVTGAGRGTAVKAYYGADLIRPVNASAPPAGIEFEELPGSTAGVFVG